MSSNKFQYHLGHELDSLGSQCTHRVDSGRLRFTISSVGTGYDVAALHFSESLDYRCKSATERFLGSNESRIPPSTTTYSVGACRRGFLFGFHFLNGLGGIALLGTLMIAFIASLNLSNASGPSIISG